MTPDALTANWREQFGEIPPVGYLLREAFPQRWLRIHSFAGTQRYPASESDTRQLLHRHNTILSAIFDPGDRFVFLLTGYTTRDHPFGDYPQLADRFGDAQFLFSYEEPDGLAGPFHFFYTEETWQTGSLNEVLLLISEDIIANVCLLKPDATFVYHPYDGGGDILCPDDASVSRLVEHFKAREPWSQPA